MRYAIGCRAIGSLSALLVVLMSGVLPARAQIALESATFPPESEAALQRIVDKHLVANGAPGLVVGIWIPERGTRVRAQGVGDVAAGTPIGETDSMRIASIMGSDNQRNGNVRQKSSAAAS
jgi:hypothetical protein